MKQILFYTLFVCATCAAFGQKGDVSKSSVQDDGVEIFAGISGSVLRGDVTGDTDRRTSFHGGVLFILPVQETFRIKVGIGYSGRGASAAGEGTIKLNYVEAPLLLCLGSEKFNVFAGPQAALLIKSNINLSETLDAGINYGLSAGLSERGFIRLILYHGLKNTVNQPGIDIKNRYFSVVLGYRLP